MLIEGGMCVYKGGMDVECVLLIGMWLLCFWMDF